MASTPFIAEVRMFCGNFAPLGWAYCNGQLLSIAQYDTLFALIGTTYGGDGQTTFGVPDLRGRLPMHMGTGTGLSPRTIGETAGSENTTLPAAAVPAHAHSLTSTSAPACKSGPGNADTPTAGIFAGSSGDNNYTPAANANGAMAPMQVNGTSGASGGGQPFPNMQPFLTVNFIIAVEGVFPSRA